MIDRGIGDMLGRIRHLEDEVERLRTIETPRTIRVRAYHNTNQSIAHATVTNVSFNTLRSQKGLRFVSGSPVLDEAGWYTGAVHIDFAANAAGDRHVYIGHQPSGLYIAIDIRMADSTGQPTVMSIPFGYEMAIGDSISVQVFQSSGGALNILSGAAYSPEFWMVKTG